MNSRSYKDHWFIRDHLGSVRAVVDIISNTISSDKLERERSADRFAKKLWVYQKASVYAKDKINRYENQRN